MEGGNLRACPDQIDQSNPSDRSDQSDQRYFNSFKKSVMPWVMLFVAGLFECAWAVGLKYSEGFTRPVPSALTIAAMLVSFWLLSLAMKTVPVGTAYAVWTGIGAAGVAVAGILLFDESRDLARLFCIFLIIAGVAGLRLLTER